MLLWNRHLFLSCPSFERSWRQCHRSPVCLLTAISSHCLAAYLQKCLRSTVTCGKMLDIVTSSEHQKICCHVIVTQKSLRVKQSARKLNNLPLQVKERTRVNCKLTTAWHQNREPGYFAVWVSYSRTGWSTVIARNKSIKRNSVATDRFTRKFWFLFPISREGQIPVLDGSSH